jgi:hypothetical protein
VVEFRIDRGSPVLERPRDAREQHLLRSVAELQTTSHGDFAAELPHALTGTTGSGVRSLDGGDG